MRRQKLLPRWNSYKRNSDLGWCRNGARSIASVVSGVKDLEAALKALLMLALSYPHLDAVVDDLFGLGVLESVVWMALYGKQCMQGRIGRRNQQHLAYATSLSTYLVLSNHKCLAFPRSFLRRETRRQKCKCEVWKSNLPRFLILVQIRKS